MRKYNSGTKDFHRESKRCEGASALDMMGYIINFILLIITMTIAISALIIAEQNKSALDKLVDQ